MSSFDFTGFIHSAFVDYLLPGLFSLGLVVFSWGIFQYYIQGGSDEEAREKSKALMMYGILTFIVMVFFWGVGHLIGGPLSAE